MTTQQTIPLAGVKLALMAAKLRRYSKGRTALLAACTPRPWIEIDCHRHTPRPSEKARAVTSGMVSDVVGPLDRGHIAALIERVRLYHGIPEVRRTFGCGIKALRAENPWTLFGGKKGGAA